MKTYISESNWQAHHTINNVLLDIGVMFQFSCVRNPLMKA